MFSCNVFWATILLNEKGRVNGLPTDWSWWSTQQSPRWLLINMSGWVQRHHAAEVSRWHWEWNLVKHISQILQCVNNRLKVFGWFVSGYSLFHDLQGRQIDVSFQFHCFASPERFTSKTLLYMLAKNANFQGGSGSERWFCSDTPPLAQNIVVATCSGPVDSWYRAVSHIDEESYTRPLLVFSFLLAALCL
jgi:hypothetical protein